VARTCRRLVPAVLVALVGCADTTDDLLPERELSATEGVVLDEIIWIVGGVSGPDGTQPPDSSDLPPRWGPNPLVTAYDLDGRVVDRLDLPLEDGASLYNATVVRAGGDEYVLGTECVGFAFGCHEDGALAVFRLGDGIDRVDVSDVALPVTDGQRPSDGRGWVSAHLGRHGRLTWALQSLGRAGGPERFRLVALDLERGEAVEVPLAQETVRPEGLCVIEDTAYQAQPTPDGRGARIFHRDLTSVDGQWLLLAELPSVTTSPATVQGLACSSHHQEVVLLMAESLLQVTASVAVGDGSVIAGPEPMPSTIMAFVWQGTDLAVWQDAGQAEEVLRRYAGAGAWEDVDVDLNRRALTSGWILIDEAIYDIEPWRGHAYAERGPKAELVVPLGDA
jgi:hypothetical protein